VSGEAFSILRHIARERLRRGRLTVIDATSLQYRSRRPLLRMARSVQVPIVAIVFNLGRDSYFSNNLARIDRQIPAAAIEKQLAEFETTHARLPREGYANIYELDTAALNEAIIERTRNSSESLPPA
jgi:predicted kinase